MGIWAHGASLLKSASIMTRLGGRALGVGPCAMQRLLEHNGAQPHKMIAIMTTKGTSEWSIKE